MSTKTLTALAVWALILGLMAVGCKKPKPAAKIDPHSPEAVNQAMQHQQVLLSEAMKTNNLQFIHGQMYYVQTLATAMSNKLEGERKERIDPMLEKLKQIAEEIDNSAGRHHQAATEANLQSFYLVLKDLDAEFKSTTDKK